MNLYLTTICSGKKRRFFIESEKDNRIAFFDSFKAAASVLRYLQGAYMSKEDLEYAEKAIESFDEYLSRRKLKSESANTDE